MTNPSSPDNCPFCSRIEAGEVTAENAMAAAFPDGFPISPGHLLIVPETPRSATTSLSRGSEQIAILDLTADLKNRIQSDGEATAFNIGVNAGRDAGQTIGHAHLHLIPRYPDDVGDPRGGVRWIIPDKAAYWETGTADGFRPEAPRPPAFWPSAAPFRGLRRSSVPASSSARAGSPDGRPRSGVALQTGHRVGAPWPCGAGGSAVTRPARPRRRCWPGGVRNGTG